MHPVPMDDTYKEWGYFIVAVDDPYEAVPTHGQDQG